MLQTRPAKGCSAGKIHPVRARGLIAAVMLVWWVGHCSGLKAEDKVSFNFQIEPLLADRCFKCHGPDDKARKAKLRFDDPQIALGPLADGNGKRAIVPGHPERSELYRRITAENPKERMPPVGSKLSLSEAEKELLGRWIAQGAEFKRHWSFIPVPDEVPIPVLSHISRVRNPIDAFVLAGLERDGFTLSKEASRETLIRRAQFRPARAPADAPGNRRVPFRQIARRLRKVVDRLLASPAYGERRANEWLDLARYADTYGYQADVERDMSPWRDWVIRSFNEDLPYDRFITDQVAGDLLPSATRDEVLATAFNRLHRQTNEGGSVEEEFRVEYCVDRVEYAGHRLPGPHRRLRPLPRPQVRPHQPEGLLPPLRLLRLHR